MIPVRTEAWLGDKVLRGSHRDFGTVVVRFPEEFSWAKGDQAASDESFHCALERWKRIGLEPGIAKLLAAGFDYETGYWTMESHVEGTSLRGLIDAAKRPYSPGEALDLLLPLLDVLSTLHQRGLGHGRLTLDRVLLRRTFRPVEHPITVVGPAVSVDGTGAMKQDLFALATIAAQLSGRTKRESWMSAGGAWDRLLAQVLDPQEENRPASVAELRGVLVDFCFPAPPA